MPRKVRAPDVASMNKTASRTQSADSTAASANDPTATGTFSATRPASAISRRPGLAAVVAGHAEHTGSHANTASTTPLQATPRVRLGTARAVSLLEQTGRQEKTPVRGAERLPTDGGARSRSWTQRRHERSARVRPSAGNRKSAEIT
jgi:hypothetical protein